MQVRDDVTRTSDESEVGLDARTDRHATVQRRRHHDDTTTGTDRAKLVVVAVLFTVARRRYNRTHQSTLTTIKTTSVCEVTQI